MEHLLKNNINLNTSKIEEIVTCTKDSLVQNYGKMKEGKIDTNKFCNCG